MPSLPDDLHEEDRTIATVSETRAACRVEVRVTGLEIESERYVIW
jgi:hypothetical protein